LLGVYRAQGFFTGPSPTKTAKGSALLHHDAAPVDGLVRGDDQAPANIADVDRNA
jgi:hypothetical protein